MIGTDARSQAPAGIARGTRRYSVYGLRLTANRDLPGLEQLATDPGEPDIEVHMGSLPKAWDRGCAGRAEPYYVSPETGAKGRPWLVVECHSGSVYHFAYDEGVEFVLDAAAATLWCRWGAGVAPDDAALYLLGPILGFVLRLRGVVCLHSGAVVTEGRALSVVGASGSGKSTLTAVLARQGCPVLSDDVLPISRGNDGLNARSGYPRLRLRPDLVEHLYGTVDAKPLLSPTWDRRCLDLAAEGLAFHAGSVPLGAVYVLDRGEDAPGQFSIERLQGHGALSVLVANTYRNELLTRAMRRTELMLLADLVRQVPVLRLCLGPGLADLDGLGARLLEDFQRRSHVPTR